MDFSRSLPQGEPPFTDQTMVPRTSFTWFYKCSFFTFILHTTISTSTDSYVTFLLQTMHQDLELVFT